MEKKLSYNILSILFIFGIVISGIAGCEEKGGDKDALDVDGYMDSEEVKTDIFEEDVDLDNQIESEPVCSGDYQSCGEKCYQVCDCSLEKIVVAIEAAPSESTIYVPEGNCVWSGNLKITKGIILNGAGIGKTLITSNYDGIEQNNCFNEGNYLIVYSPAQPELNEKFRITGFTFDFSKRCAGIYLKNQTTIPVSRVRIDNNEIKNAGYEGGTARAIEISGTVYGVIDNNQFSGNESCIDSYGINEDSWNNLTFTFGSADCIYYEDNTFIITDTPHGGGAAGRYCARYNTYIHENPDNGLYPWFDMHGNMGEGGNYSTMGVEIYGNKIRLNYNNGIGMFDQRGGKAVIFYNKAETSSSCSAKVREEYDDSRNPTTNTQPQHVSDSYFWNNRCREEIVPVVEPVEETGTATGGGEDYLEDANANFSASFANPARYGLVIYEGTGSYQSRLIVGATSTRLTVSPNWDVIPDTTSKYRIVDDCCDVIEENSEFFNQNENFDGTSGMGCGPLSSMPATCTPGTGYWATDQSCTTVSDDYCGAHPTNPLNGTLYKCTAPDTWTPYFTPYTYPHPLRSE